MSNGSESRLASLYAEHNDRLVSELARVLRDQWHLAEDLAQETWIEVGAGLRWRSREAAGFEWVLEVAGRLLTRHFRVPENRGRNTVVSHGLASARLPLVASSEDEALANLGALERLEDEQSRLEQLVPAHVSRAGESGGFACGAVAA